MCSILLAVALCAIPPSVALNAEVQHTLHLTRMLQNGPIPDKEATSQTYLPRLAKGITTRSVVYIVRHKRFGIMRSEVLEFWGRAKGQDLGPSFFISLLRSESLFLRETSVDCLNTLITTPGFKGAQVTICHAVARYALDPGLESAVPILKQIPDSVDVRALEQVGLRSGVGPRVAAEHALENMNCPRARLALQRIRSALAEEVHTLPGK